MVQITTGSENTVKAYEFLKDNKNQMFTIKEIATALGLSSAQILGGLTSLNKKGAVDKHEVEVEGKALKAYSASGVEVEFITKEPAKMSDKAIRVLEYLKNGGSGQTHAEIAEALEVAPDELLYGTEKIKKIDYDEELKMLLEDCNDFEMHVLGEMLVNTKRSIRSNLLLLNRKK